MADIYAALVTKRVRKAAYEQKAYQMVINGHSGAFLLKLPKAFAEGRV